MQYFCNALLLSLVLRELYTWIYEWINVECTTEDSDCLQKRFDGILFSSSLHVIPKGSVLNLKTALSEEFPGNSFNSAFPYKAPPAVREWIYRDLYLYSACEWFLSGQKRIEFARPAVDFERLMKNKLMWILHI